MKQNLLDEIGLKKLENCSELTLRLLKAIFNVEESTEELNIRLHIVATLIILKSKNIKEAKITLMNCFVELNKIVPWCKEQLDICLIRILIPYISNPSLYKNR